MAVPDFQSLLLPLLEAIGDGQVHYLRDLYEKLAMRFHLSGADREELLPSGQQSRFENRVAWAKSYLKQAGLLDSPQRATCQITKRGLEVLASPPEKITIGFLMRFPEFAAFRAQSSGSATGEHVGREELLAEETTPEEVLQASYQRLRNELAEELLDKIKKGSPAFFERLVIQLLLRMGYGGTGKDAGTAIGRSGDGGIDGIIKEDRLGLDVIYVQAKRWENTVGRPVVQGFSGSLDGRRARKGILITTSQFSADAHEYAQQIEKKIILIDGQMLANLMIEFDLGVRTKERYDVKRVDEDFFAED